MICTFNTGCEVWSKDSATGEWGDTGEESLSFTTSGHLDPRSASEVYTKDQKMRIRTHTLYLKLRGEVVDESNFLVINGQRFEILGVRDYGHHVEIDLELIR